ncbi:titin-like isoform X2 [Parambassis ranga]|uniref:Titin-like isoform X2 n=1 Tax=Parambassis ranga TaxID=210632 RepID=A0A6P7H4W7_9TELE|nr:titin-like isoform X2 [Parambassis ranga]
MSRQSFLASFIFTWCIVAGQTTEYGLLGGTINIKTGIKTAIDEILWKHNGNKAVEFNGNEEHAYSSFEHRVTLDWHSADLSISGLTYEDSGNYDLEAFSDNLLQRLKYTLKVIDKVAKPTISCKILNDNDNSGHVAKLTCSAEPSQPPALMTFEWTSHSHSGPELPILLGHEQDKEVYSCTVSNPLTNDSATFTAKDCYGESSTGRTVGIILGILAGIVFLILFILFMWWRLKHKEKNSDEENRAPEKINGPEDETGDSESRKPLIHRSSTRPSEQRLDHWNRSETDVENHEDKDEKIPPVPKKRHSHVDPHNNGDLESEPADPVKATDALINEQAEDTKHHMADDLQSPTANEQPDVENHEDKVSPPVPKKRRSRVDPHNNGDLEREPAHPVKATDASFNEQTEDTQHQMADDLQSPAANEQPDVQKHKDKVKKPPPPVPKKRLSRAGPHNNGDLENEPADPVKATDASFNKQTEDTQHQMADDLRSPTANKQPDVETHKDEDKKIPLPVPKKRLSRAGPHNNGDLESEPAHPVKAMDASFNEQTEDTQHQMADDLQSPAANEQPGLPTKTPPPVPEKPRFGLPPHNNGDLENKPADPVKATDASFNEQTEDTQHQMADDLQSPAANEQPDVQKHKVKVKKPPPPVPKKRHSYVDPHNNGDLENEPADPVKTTDASFNEQAEDTQHQMADDLRSPTANEQPEKEAEEDEKEEEDANTDQAAGKSTEANVRESDSTGLREGNESDNLSMEQEGREGEEATAHKQQSKINTVKDNQQEQKEEENVVLDTTQSLRAP